MMFTEELFASMSLSDEFYEMISSLFDKDGDKYDFHLSGGAAISLGEGVHKLYGEFYGRQTGYMDVIRAHMVSFIVQFFRKVFSADGEKKSPKLRSAIRSTIAYIEENYTRQISLSELAGRIFFSKDYLNKVFHSEVGMTVGAYIQKMRLERAANLLLKTDKTISEIAEISGFGDVKSFYTVFKRNMKMTPGEYRESGV